MALKKFAPTKDYSKAGFEAYIDRHGRTGAPLIWPEGTDPEAVERWRTDLTPKGERKARLKPKGGAFYLRTTNFLDVLDDKENLAAWRERQVLLGVKQNPDHFIAEMEGLDDPDDPDTKKALNGLVKRAREMAHSDLKASLGTALHAILEDIDQGIDPGPIPPEYEQGIEEYVKATKDMQMVAVEKFGVWDRFQIGGTLDRLVVWKGRLMVGDVKTSQSIDFARGKYGMQFRAYAEMSEYDPQTFKRTPYSHEGLDVDKETALLLHMPSGGTTCNVYEVPIKDSLHDLELCAKVREYRRAWSSKTERPFTLVSGTDA